MNETELLFFSVVLYRQYSANTSKGYGGKMEMDAMMVPLRHINPPISIAPAEMRAALSTIYLQR